MVEEILVGLDIGASSVKAGAFDRHGTPLALASRPNAPVPQPGGKGWFMWDAPGLRAACEGALREITGTLARSDRIRSVAATGFGADGAPFSSGGEQRYPIISWHDSRAAEEIERLARQLGTAEIYATSGYHPYPINTLGRWLWLRERFPESLDDATWLMIPDLAAWWLSGEMRTDPTSASTTMAFDLRNDRWASDLFAAADVSLTLPPPLAEPGETIGVIGAPVATRSGLPAGVVVAAGGHDCEVGTYAATARLPETTFIDITGTWEMLIVPTHEFAPSEELFDHGIDWERHTWPGRYLCQSLMPAGSVLSWLRDLAYADSAEPWRAMIADAEASEPGADGVKVIPSFVPGMGPLGRTGAAGSILGLQTTTTRGQLVRAALEALCYQLLAQLEVLERATGRRCETLRVLGGGRRNDFWLQLKADVTGRVVEAVETEELTLLGAALLGGVAAGVYAGRHEAQHAAALPVRSYEPQPDRHARYRERFEFDYLPALPFEQS